MKTRRNGDDHTAEFDLGGVVTPPNSRPWYRSALAEKISPRHRKTRIAAFVILGLGKAVRRGTVAGGVAVKGKVQATRAQRKEIREDPEWQYSRRFGGAVFLCAPCRTKFPSARLLNDHFVLEHMDEEWLARPKPTPPVQRHPATPKTYTPKPPTNRRPQTGKRASGQAQHAAYRAPATTIGKRAMNKTVAARMIHAAGVRIAESSPQTLTELREQVLGVEQALGVLREGFEQYARTLRAEHGRREGLAPEIVNPHFGRASQGIADAETALAAFIFNFEEQFGPAIRAAANGGHGGAQFLAG